MNVHFSLLFLLPLHAKGPMAGRKYRAVPGKQHIDTQSHTPKSTATKKSTDSQDSAPLTNPYMATHIVDGIQSVVQVPEGASHLSIQCHSTRLASCTPVVPPVSTEPPVLTTECTENVPLDLSYK
jgi:hypothetical protein